MKKYYGALVLCSLFFSFTASSQYSRYIVRLKDKKGTAYSLGNPSAYLSAKALDRRTRFHIATDSADLPVSGVYLDSLRAVPNVTILNVSKWLNQVCIKTTDPAALAKINSFSFVKSEAPIAVRQMQPMPVQASKINEFIQAERPVATRVAGIMDAFGTTGTQDFYNYGSNAGQIHIHEGEYLHNLGFHGEGITIAILDGGFLNYKTNIAFDSIRAQNQILGTWDYVANEQSVNEDNAHGTWCLSVIAANEPGKIVGTAPKAKFWLLRTEDVFSEYPVEEQNWVAGAEFADSVGADIISSSLGYSDFNDHSFDHSYAQRDGTTSIVSRGAAIAVRKGILVTNSAGNSGDEPGDLIYVACPADVDSVLTVGATDVNGIMGSFSSYGPNGAGHLKPNVVSVGVNAVVASSITGNPATLSGTSFSNPNMCGLVACLWQAFPEFNNMEIMGALQRSASKYNNPDYRFGYGIPNMRLAYLDLQQQSAVRNSLKNKWLKAYPVPFNSNMNVLVKAPKTGHGTLHLIDMAGKIIETKTIDVQEGMVYNLSFERLRSIAPAIYTIQYTDGKNRASVKVVKQ